MDSIPTGANILHACKSMLQIKYRDRHPAILIAIYVLVVYDREQGSEIHQEQGLAPKIRVGDMVDGCKATGHSTRDYRGPGLEGKDLQI